MIPAAGIIGFTGRMGQSIAEIIRGHAGICLAGGLIRKDIKVEPCEKAPDILTDDPEELFPHCDVLIDFSHASATAMFARLAEKHKKPFVCGTTGLALGARKLLDEIAETVPVIYASNTSLSLVVTRYAAMLTAKLLKDYDYDLSILDKHHKWKKDAPSGTALTLGEAIREASEGRFEPEYASMRGGSIIGEHDILFAGAGENITIQHQVTDRRIFARGAVEAAIWLADKPPGRYTMDDVLGLS